MNKPLKSVELFLAIGLATTIGANSAIAVNAEQNTEGELTSTELDSVLDTANELDFLKAEGGEGGEGGEYDEDDEDDEDDEGGEGGEDGEGGEG